MTDKLFNDDDLDDNEEVEINEDDPLAPFVAKYHDEKGIAKALLEKDNFIKRLQREAAELRTEVVTRSRVEEAVDRLLTKQPNTPSSNPPVTNSGDDEGNGNGSQKQGLSEADVRAIMEGERNKLIAEQNVATAKAKLTELYGEDWPKVVAKKGKEIGESTEFFDALARKNPNALLAMLGAPEKKPSGPTLFEGTVNTTSTVLKTGEGTSQRNQSYYNKLKSTSPKDYWSPRVQNQMHKDAIALGPSFFT